MFRLDRRWLGWLLLLGVLGPGAGGAGAEEGGRPWIAVRGIYGGVPTPLLAGGKSLADSGVNAVWIGSGGLDAATIDRLHAQGAKVFAEFNTLHEAGYLAAHPDAAPVGPDGKPAPAPDGWQGVCPTHPGYRAERMAAFRKALRDFAIDGIWLDYHHAHASWEQAEPALPDTCFCARCLARFEADTGTDLPDRPTPELADELLGARNDNWVAWRCGVFTDWVREFRAIRDEVRPKAVLGTFHCPWSADDRDGALRRKLAIDLRAQAALVDVLSPMPYHARFGHAQDVEWISRQTAWLGRYLSLQGTPGETPQIWPIVQLADWGERVPPAQVAAVIDHGSRPPATGLMAFHWSGLAGEPAKLGGLAAAYRGLAAPAPGDPRAADRVTGTVGYRERIALPPTAVVRVQLVDVSLADAPAIVLGSREIPAGGKQAPFAFAIPFEAATIEPGHTYAVQARIVDGDRLLFISDRQYPVITRDAPRTADLLLRAVGRDRPGP